MKFAEWGRDLLVRKGASDFNPSSGGKRTFATGLIPGARQLSIGEIMAPGGTNNIRDISTDYWFGPLQPITPVAPSSYRPRQFGYTPGSNVIWTPKGESPIGFEVLRALADSWDLLRLAIETQKDRICKTKFQVRAKLDAAGIEKHVDWEQRNAKDPNVKALNKFLNKPDGFHDFATWLRMWMEDMIVCDAVALWLERDMQGRIASVHPIAGDTINRLLTDQGLTPPAPQAAYQQVVYGTPACDLTTDDLVYYMRNERTNKRYGFSPVEQILITISIGLRRQEFQLQYYTSGNVPEALCFLPGDIPSDKVKEYQDFFDAMLAGDLSKRRRLTFLPGFGTDGKAQSTVQFTKDKLLKDEMDEWLARVVCMSIGISPTPFTKQVNRATAEQAQETSEEEGKEPYVASALSIVNHIIQNCMGMDDYEAIREEEIELDVLKQAQADNLMAGKIMPVNEIRKRRGLDRYDDQRADMLGTWAPAIGFIPLGEVGNALTTDEPASPGVDEGIDTPAGDKDPTRLGIQSGITSPTGRTKPNGKDKGKPNGKAHRSGLVKAGAARFRHGSLQHIKAGVLTHTSQDAKTAFEALLTRKFHTMRNRTVQLLHAAVNKTLSVGDLAKLDVETVAEFEKAAAGKWRYSVNHVFEKPMQLRPRGKRPYGKKSQIVEQELNIADLVPTQYWVKPLTVLEYAKDNQNDNTDQPLDKPVHVVLLAGTNSLLLSDGHHRTVARMLRGETKVQAVVFPRWATDTEIARDRDKKRACVAGDLAKVDDFADIVTNIMDALMEEFGTIPEDATAYIQQAVLSGLTQGVLQVNINDTSMLTDVNETARQWAADRAAELVGMQYDAAGNLVANPNAQWTITATTREAIQEVVTDAFAGASDFSAVAEAIDGTGIFDTARAVTIAKTEISRAQMQGNLELWIQSGVVQEYDWLLSEDNPCDECQEIADGGPYVLGEGPVPIDDSHPNCECIIAAVLFDES